MRRDVTFTEFEQEVFNWKQEFEIEIIETDRICREDKQEGGGGGGGGV